MTSQEIGQFLPTQPVQGHTLELLGKEAARFAETSGLGLTEAVVQTLSDEKLGSEQVTRVVEFANIEAFQRKFASMDSSNRIVDIAGGPADPRLVLQTLNDQAQPRAVEVQSLDYMMPPESKVASVVDFGLGFDSRPEPSRTRGGVLQDLSNLKSKLSAAIDEMHQTHESTKHYMLTSLTKLNAEVRRAAAHDGLMHEDLVSAWARVDPELMSTALKYMPKVASRGKIKVAHRINPNHPVVSGYEDFVKHAHRFESVVAARRNLEQRMVQVEAFIAERLT